MPFISEFRAQLASNDAHWAPKLSLRVLIILINITVFGLSVDFAVDDFDIRPWVYIPLAASVIWCIIVVIYHVLRKSPVHPGVEVGIDLVLWLAFAIISSLTVVAAVESYQWDDTFDDDDCPRFSSCVDESDLNKTQNRRRNIELAGGILMILLWALHFAHFVWACVDTSRRNSAKAHTEARSIANAMIAEMVANGQIPPPRQPLLVPSQRGSQAVSEAASRETGALPYMTPAGGYYAPQYYEKGQARPQSQPQHQSQPHQQMQMAGPAPPVATALAHQQEQPSPPLPPRTASPQAAPPPQQVKSEGDSSQNGNGDHSGFHTPHSQPTSPGYRAVSTDNQDDPDAIRPLPPVRAPGHTYSP